MKNNLQIYYNSVIVYDLISKLPRINNQFQIPKINNISINLGLKTITSEKQKIVTMLTLLKLISNQEPLITKATKNNLFFKIKKNTIIGCKLTLHKKTIYYFLEKLIFFRTLNFTNLNINNKSLTFKISNKQLLNFYELKSEFFTFQNLPAIDIIVQINTLNNFEFLLLLNAFFFKK